MAIHPTAIVDPSAELGDVTIGPFAIIEAGAVLRDGVSVGPHSVICGGTVVGERTRVGAHVVLGGDPQDLKHDGSQTRLEIGADNVFREFATAHRGSSTGTGVTTIGDGNYFMVSSHVAHDCRVGNGCMFANGVAIGGHAEVGDYAVLGGLAAVHQFNRVGRLAMVGGGAMCTQDIPPFTLAQGDRARLFGLNVIGLKRRGFDGETLSDLKTAWRQLFVSGLPLKVTTAELRNSQVPEVRELIEFITSSQRGVARSVGR